MKLYKYIAYVFAGDQAWRVSSNSKQRVKNFAREKEADSYALLYKYELKRTEEVPAGYVRAKDGWCQQWRWFNAIPAKFKQEDAGVCAMSAIHRRMEEVAVHVEV